MQTTLAISVGALSGEGYQEVKFSGEFDKAGYSAVKDELNDVVKNFAGKSLVFNFASLKFINSEGIGHLMEIHTHLTKSDKRLVLVASNPHVEDVFNAVGIKEIMPLFPNLEAFLNSK